MTRDDAQKKIARMWAEGYACHVIAANVRLTQGTVRGVIRTHGFLRDVPEQRIRRPWTESEKASVEAMWRLGKSGGAIARIIGRSRNAVIGWIHRRGIVRGAPGHAPAPPPRYTQPTQPKAKKATARALPSVEAPTPPPSGLIAFADLSFSSCRYPIGDPKISSFGFCGASRVLGGPYCAHHARLTRTPARSIAP